MSKYKDVLKKGWHPEKEGTTFRGQVKGLVGRGESKDDKYKDHVSRPLNTLTDPSSLPPPPQRRGTGLAPPPPPSAAISGGDKRKVVVAPSKYQDPRAAPVEPPARITRDPHLEPETDDQQLMIEEAPPPPRPYRTNTTGLRTDHLPPPPGRRDGADGRSPPSYNAATNTTGVTRAVPTPPARGGAPPARGGAPPPSLPPRLPPRGAGGAASPAAASPQSTGNGGGGLLNLGAVNRLGAAGVSVPGFGIGKSNTGGSTNSGSGGAQQQQQQGGAHMNELTNRFARFNSSSSSSSTQQQATPAAAPSQGTTWAQKQAALKTASQFQKDPSQVSFSDAKAAAGTANNFRQRHGEQVAAGYSKAQGVNQKYGVADKVGGFASKFGGGGGGGGGAAQEQGVAPAEGAAPAPATGVGKKKPPPPPPKKKPGLAASAAAPAEEDGPPPIPMSTRPNF